MKTLNFLLLWIGFLSITYAQKFEDIKNASSAHGRPIFNQKNINETGFLPQPEEGIKIISSQQFLMNKQAAGRTKKLMSEYRKNGFVNKKSMDAIRLLMSTRHYFLTHEKKTYLNSKDPFDSHLKQTIDQIQLAFDFHPIRFIPSTHVIGFAAADTWVKQPKAGWTGIAEVFMDTQLGICDYKRSHAQLNHAAVYLNEETVSYKINNKPTLDIVEGNGASGYIYQVDWFDADYYHTLQCAQSSYNPKTIQGVLDLAKRIDAD